MDAPTPLARLIEAKMRAAGRLKGGDLHDLLISWRRPLDGKPSSWDRIASELVRITAEYVTGPTVASWYEDLKEPKPEPAP